VPLHARSIKSSIQLISILLCTTTLRYSTSSLYVHAPWLP
jgi:hypothetical protein